MFRIYPLSIAACLIYHFGHIPSIYDGAHFYSPELSKAALIANLLLIQNITHSESLLAPLWSLPYEMQMYLVIPAVFSLCLLKGRTGIICLYVATISALLGLAFLGTPAVILNFVPCFLGGAFVFTSHTKAFINWRWLPISLLAIAALLSKSSLVYSIPSQWVIALGIAMAVPCFKEIENKSIKNASNLIARYSFGIYLFHYGAIQFCFGHMQNKYAAVSVSLVLTFVFAVAGYHLLEKPFIDIGKRLSNPIFHTSREDSFQSDLLHTSSMNAYKR